MDIVSTILGVVLGSICTLLYDFFKNEKQKKYFLLEKLYVPFRVLYDSHHSGSAYSFTDLSKEQQKEIIKLLNENLVYTKYNKKLFDKMYTLITSFHDFQISAKSKNSKQTINDAYYELTGLIFDKSDKELKAFFPSSIKKIFVSIVILIIIIFIIIYINKRVECKDDNLYKINYRVNSISHNFGRYGLYHSKNKCKK